MPNGGLGAPRADCRCPLMLVERMPKRGRDLTVATNSPSAPGTTHDHEVTTYPSPISGSYLSVVFSFRIRS